jgi:DUF1009 family protein
MAAGAEGGLAIVAGRGVLPRLIAEDCARRGRSYRVVAFEGVPLDWTAGHPVVHGAFEKPGRLFAELRASGCRAVTFAGGMARPTLNPLRFDLTMLRHAPKVLGAIRGGDDRTLRTVAEIVEGEGFLLVPAQAIVDGLVAMAGVSTRAQPSDDDRADAARAAAIVEAIGGVDVGQAAVVAQGVCLGVESVQGTDALLAFVERTAGPFRADPTGARGVLFKAPKPGQDWRMDLPAVGPDTLRAAAAAGLAGVVVQAGGVLVLGRDETVAAANSAGLFLWGRPR